MKNTSGENISGQEISGEKILFQSEPSGINKLKNTPKSYVSEDSYSGESGVSGEKATPSGIEICTVLEQETGFLIDEINRLSEENERYLDMLSQLASSVENLENQIVDQKRLPNLPPKNNKYEFVLEKDADGSSDESWEKIIKEGQRIQYEYWNKSEKTWNSRVKMPEGWHGSAMSPVIKIMCEEPEYIFKNTVRLPGRFCLSSSRRWSSVLRFYTFGDKVLKDDTGYGYKWDSPVCIYVEGKTYVDMPDGGEMVMKPFEQTIEEVIICPMLQGTPIYLSEDQDRLSIRNCKILSHGGSQVGIRHGPKLAENKYPWQGVEQSKQGDYNVWLTDPRFVDLQMEGPHNNKRPQAAMLMTGANIMIQNLNLYGWMQGPYLHGGINRVINGLTQHWGNTSDGRKFCSKEEVVSYIVSHTSINQGSDSFNCIAGGFKKWYLRKSKPCPYTGGWHKKGENIL